MAAKPRLLLAAPFDTDTGVGVNVTATQLSVFGGSPVVPRDYLAEYADGVLAQLAAFVSSPVSGTTELLLSFIMNGANEDLPGTTIHQTNGPNGSLANMLLSQPVDITAQLRKTPLPAFQLLARVTGGTGLFSYATLLLLRRT